MDNGWIKIYRKIQDWEWYKNSEMVHLLLHFLILANHEKGQWQGQILEPGQFITGLDKLNQQTKIPLQTIRTCINKLKSTGEITNKSTNKYRIITLLKWGDYQTKYDKLTSKSDDDLTNNQQTTNKQLTNKLTANKKYKKEKNNKEATTIVVEQGSGFGKPEINQLWEYGKTLGFSTTKQTLNRYAINRLLKASDFERVKSAAEFSQKIRDEDYAPQINNWMDLEEKLLKLRDWYKRNTKPKESKTLVL